MRPHVTQVIPLSPRTAVPSEPSFAPTASFARTPTFGTTPAVVPTPAFALKPDLAPMPAFATRRALVPAAPAPCCRARYRSMDYGASKTDSQLKGRVGGRATRSKVWRITCLKPSTILKPTLQLYHRGQKQIVVAKKFGGSNGACNARFIARK
ncbi:unnamed protein product [Agarophyton chilense]